MFIVNQSRWSASIGGLMDLPTLLLLNLLQVNAFHYDVNIEGRVDLGSIEVRNDQGSS